MSDPKAENDDANSAAKAGQEPAPPALPVLAYATPDKYRTGIRRDGAYLVLPRGMELPDLCIMCGVPAEEYIPVSFDAGLTLSNAKLRAGMCRRHARLYRIPRYVLGTLFGAAGLGLYAVMASTWFSSGRPRWSNLEAPMILANILLAVSIALFLIRTPPLWCHRFNAAALWIGGAQGGFLSHFSPVEHGGQSYFSREIL